MRARRERAAGRTRLTLDRISHSCVPTPFQGYQVGDNCAGSCSDGAGNYDAAAEGAGEGQMYFYENSHLRIEWTMQHGCGHANENVRCDLVLQYMCEDSAPNLRDGKITDTIPATAEGATNTQFGMHEPLQHFQNCEMRERNKGLYVADQILQGVPLRAPLLPCLKLLLRPLPNLTPHRRECSLHEAESYRRA
eukprot:scaffold22528_cov30-Tisochrysis_lutea.AAC.5